MVAAKGVEAKETTRKETSTTTISVFSLDSGGLPAAFLDLGAYGNETWKMSENKVVHHNRHYRKLLPWF
jgi:hypothetical protein